MAETLASLGITPEKIRQYDQRIPRYTSYPTAPFWTSDFGPKQWQQHVEKNSASNAPLSLYVHIPFCEKHCLFCACNVIITSKKEVAEDYLQSLLQEIRLVRNASKGTGLTGQLHLGGGTPNYFTIDQLQRLLVALEDAFPFAPDADRSIEIDPRAATPAYIRALHEELGFRRISFGVQDVHEDTQQAIGRGQARQTTIDQVQAARDAGFASVNIDLIYGLPRQTAQSWRETLDIICDLKPDRMAVYNFAFLPTKLAHQRALNLEVLPDAPLKLEMFVDAHNRLTTEGWEFIGMDHYSRRDEALARAQRDGTLNRNFMGYTTLRGTDMLAFGTSAISDYKNAFAQNTKKLSVYKRLIDEGTLPTEHGIALSDDDVIRRHIITELMCNNVLHFDSDCGVPNTDFRAIIMAEEERLEPLADDGLVTLEPDALRLTRKGRMFLRNVAVLFDAYASKAEAKNITFSKAI